MNARRIIAAGLRRGVIELWQLARSPKEIVGYLTVPMVFIAVALAVDEPIPNTTVTTAQLLFTGGISFMVFQIGLINLPQILVTEREDGTLLRVRSLPGGMPAYLLGKALLIGGTALVNVVLLAVAGVAFADLPLPSSAGDWLTLAWVLALGLLSVVGLGAAFGAVLPNAREALGFLMIPVMALLFISGVMFPATNYADIVQQVASVFPLKWMALGVRSAMLPDSMLAAEAVTTSWQHPMILMVLAAWTVGGMLLAPPLLRRMTRRQSGSRLNARRGQLADRVA